VANNGGKKPRIVVGVDGSDSSRHALRWAAPAGAAHGWTPRGGDHLGASHLLRLGASVSGGLQSRRGRPAGCRRGGRCRIERMPDVVVQTTVVEGHPAPTLLQASRGADLLVLGSRGHGEFAGMLIGSVSQHLVSTAHCPRARLAPRRPTGVVARSHGSSGDRCLACAPGAEGHSRRLRSGLGGGRSRRPHGHRGRPVLLQTRLRDLQGRLWAEGRRSLLVVPSGPRCRRQGRHHQARLQRCQSSRCPGGVVQGADG